MTRRTEDDALSSVAVRICWSVTRGRGSGLTRRYVFALIACLFFNSSVDSHFTRIDAETADGPEEVEEVPAELKRLEQANPEVDFRDAIKRRDFRFLGVAGFTLTVPGVPMSDENMPLLETHGVRVIPGTSDNPASLTLQISAARYAERYNKLLLDHLRKAR